jgi:hypothetical protein
MRFSVLHLSDLHRDLDDEVSNLPLVDSISRDVRGCCDGDLRVVTPAVCVVSGDLVYGIRPGSTSPEQEITRQYEQVCDFLVQLADELFNGDRDRVILLPGNHDVYFEDVVAACQRVEIPSSSIERAKLVSELHGRHSKLRWSWKDFCFYRIADDSKYRARFRHFAKMYSTFYQGRREYPLLPNEQAVVFDYPELQFSVSTLNSCYNNDPFRRAAAFHPDCVTTICRAARSPERAGWLSAAAWHHSITGSPTDGDHLDHEILQSLIDAGISIGFHGHQHFTDYVEERYRLGAGGRKITIVSAGTLCAGPKALAPGKPRSYNIFEFNRDNKTSRLHQREMVNRDFGLPIWGPGYFLSSGAPYIDISLEPLSIRAPGIDAQLGLARADQLIGVGRWEEAIRLLVTLKGDGLARRLLSHALSESGDNRRIIELLSPPESAAEAVLLGGAVYDEGTAAEKAAFLTDQSVTAVADASVTEIRRRIEERRNR